MKVMIPCCCLTLFFASANLYAQAPSYTNDVRPFMDKYCVECHQGNKAKAGVKLDSFESIMKGSKKGRKIVVEGEADKSQLVTCVEGTGGKKMPPKKAAKQPTDKEIKMLREWVNGGAKDDTAKESAPAKRETLPGKGSEKGQGEVSSQANGELLEAFVGGSSPLYAPLPPRSYPIAFAMTNTAVASSPSAKGAASRLGGSLRPEPPSQFTALRTFAMPDPRFRPA
jgi:mono/diheme cytochrome c family protein